MTQLVQSGGSSMLSPEDITVLEQSGIIPRGTPKANVSFFASVCRQTGLSPFKKQIHLVKRNSKQGPAYTIQTAIDGLRSIAERSGRYAGSDDALFNDSKTEFQLRTEGKKRPDTATVTVYKLMGGQRVPYTATASWSEYFPSGKNPLWEKMPFTMLSKCAEAKALRKGFGDILDGIYTDEEMHQADAPVRKPKPAPKVADKKVKEFTEKLKIELKEYSDAQELQQKAQDLIAEYKKEGVANARDLVGKRFIELTEGAKNG